MQNNYNGKEYEKYSLISRAVWGELIPSAQNQYGNFGKEV